ncbi:MAG: hypothetical protein AAF936_10475 [Pseudomonadota bacterium]
MNYQEISIDNANHGVPEERVGGVSVAEWRFEMEAGNKAFATGKLDLAASHYQRSVRVAEELIRLSEDGHVDPGCAARAMFEARRNLSENYLRLGCIDDAVEALETGFMQICLRAAWPCTPGTVRKACVRKITDCLTEFVSLLERVHAPPAKILSAYALADEAQAQWRNLESAAWT